MFPFNKTSYMKTMKINDRLQRILLVFCIAGISSCDYLDIVPDNTLTIDHAFKTRYEAEGALYGLYGFLPSFADVSSNPALLGGDEVWFVERAAVSGRLWNIARGFQGTAAPLADYWASYADARRYDLNGGVPLYTALRDCNLFLENVEHVIDLNEDERIRWKAEVKFLKAYFHFWLLRMYGPIPLIRENLPMDDPGHNAREPVDDVVEYIVSLLDEAVVDLPPAIDDIMLELGRATQPIALAVKAQTLTLAASPLFNGNPDYASFTNTGGEPLFPTTYSVEKWKRASDALEEAINAAHEAGNDLFDFKRETVYGNNLNEKTILAMQVRGAVTERWNSEIIWGASNSGTGNLQRMCHPMFFVVQGTGGIFHNYAPPLHIVEQFYTRNGIPIEEDKEWIEVDKYELKAGDEEHHLYISRNYRTMNLHFNREARFYSSIIFDGGTLYGNGRITTDNNLWVTLLKGGDPGGNIVPERSLSTGYQCKKLLHYMTSVPDENSNVSVYEYAFPIIRLADLYLMYAEALNEWKAAPDPEVYAYIDRVRARTGLEGVVDSWRNHAIASAADKPLTQEGMREIIRQERMNELAFEGIRFWDLRRWKLAKEYMNKPIRGLNLFGETHEDFYQIQEVYPLTFEDKDYLWPVRQNVLMKNNNLIQNPGW
jgi:hypothetical protein